MGRFLYLENNLAEQTTHKSVQKACESSEVCIMYFPRDAAYHIEKLPENKKTADLIRKDLALIFPELHEV